MLPKCRHGSEIRNGSEARNHILFAMVPKFKDHWLQECLRIPSEGLRRKKQKRLHGERNLAVAGITKKPLDDTSINGSYFNKKRSQDFESVQLKSSCAQEDGIFRTRALSQQVKNSVDRSNSYSIVQLTTQCFPRRKSGKIRHFSNSVRRVTFWELVGMNVGVILLILNQEIGRIFPSSHLHAGVFFFFFWDKNMTTIN